MAVSDPGHPLKSVNSISQVASQVEVRQKMPASTARVHSLWLAGNPGFLPNKMGDNGFNLPCSHLSTTPANTLPMRVDRCEYTTYLPVLAGLSNTLPML